MAVTARDFIMNAIQEGIEEAPKVFMQKLENQLKVDVKIQESGDAVSYLESMIQESEKQFNY